MVAEGAGGGRRVVEENLDFSPDGVGKPCFSLAPEPSIAPQCAGFDLRTPSGKRAEPALFVVLRARLGRFLAPVPKKWPGGPVGGAAGDALILSKKAFAPLYI